MTWENDPYWNTDLEPGWVIRREGEFVVDRRPPVNRVASKVEGTYGKELEFRRRVERPTLVSTPVDPRPGRSQVFSTQPYRQRVRLDWRDFLGV